jgi:hypothetical protein
MSGVVSSVGLATKSMGFLKASFYGARDGSEALAVSTKALKWILASTGIGALVVLLSSLAAYFTKTTKGSKELASGIAQVKAAGTVLLERFAKYGGGLWDMLKGDFAGGYKKMSQAMYNLADATKEAADRAKELAASNYDLNKAEAEFEVVKSAQLITLEEFRLKSRDIELSAKERLSSLNSAAAIEKKNNRQELDFLAERLYNAQVALSIDTQNKDKKAELREAYKLYNEKVAESIIFERTLARQKNTLTKEIRAELQAMKDMNQLDRIYIATPKVYKPVGPQVDPDALRAGPVVMLKTVNSELQEMYDATETSIENLTTGFAEWVGAFSAGLSGFRDLRQMVGNAFGDMLIALGNIAIKTGIGIEAIKKAFESLGGVGAIAIGMGLVAFGSSIKGSIQQVNNARDAAAGSVSHGSSAGGSLNYGAISATPSKLRLEGTVLLKLTGSDLLALLNNENTRIQIST